jgi:flavin-binding protein dodecin
MAIVKVIELLAESSDSWEEAARYAVLEASKTIRNIRSVYVKDLQATVEGYEIRTFRLCAKISFVVEGDEAAGG